MSIEFAEFWIRVRLVGLMAGLAMWATARLSGYIFESPGAQLLFTVSASVVIILVSVAWYRRRRRLTGQAEKVRLPWEAERR